MLSLLLHPRQMSKRFFQWGLIGFLLVLVGSSFITATFAAPNDLTLTLLSTSEADIAGNPNNVFIGEVLTYQLVYEVPQGTSTNVVITAILPPGLTYVPTATSAVVNNNGWTAPMTVTGGGSPGADVSFNFGNINNTDVDANAETITIQFKAIVNNVVANQSGTTLSVNGELRINSVLTTSSANVGVTVIEPNLSIASYTITSPIGLLAASYPYAAAGDTYNYYLSFTNSGNAPAYDIVVEIFLPLTYVFETNGTYNLSGNNTCGGASLHGILPAVVTVPCIQPGETVNVRVNVTVQATVQPLDSWLSSAVLTNYASLPDENGSNDDVPGAYGTATGARNGADGVSGALNNYATNATNSPTLSVPAIAVAFDTATSSAAEAGGIGNVLRVTTTNGNPTSTAATVNVGVTGGTASAADYNLTGTITIPAGTPHNALVSIASGITVTNENLVEPNETLQLTLSAPVNAGFGAQTSITHTIINDDTATVTIADVAQAEGNTGTSLMTFTATVDNPVQGGFVLNYTTTNLLATTADNDYVAASGTRTFVGVAGETQNINVTINGDTKVEPNETFRVSFPSASASVAPGGLIITDTAIGTITNDDTAAVTIADVTQLESGTFTFTATLNNATAGGFSVDWVVAAGTTNAADYVGGMLPTGGTLNFTGTAGETQTFMVPVLDDLIAEPTENFTVSMTNFNTFSGFTLNITDTATGTITDNDIAAYLVDTSATAASIAEPAGSTSFTIRLATEVTGTVILDFGSTDMTECVVTPTSFTFNAGNWNTAQTITINAADDLIADGTQPCAATITRNAGSTATEYNAVANPANVTLNVTDNDIAAYLVDTSATAASIAEPAGSTSFTIRLATQSTGTVILDFGSTDATECVVTPMSFTFNAGNWNTAQTITITAADDLIADGTQPCAVTITRNAGSTATEYNAVANPANVNLSVTDNDTAGISVSTIAISEGAAGVAMDVVLLSDPTANVTITLVSDAQCTLSTNTLTFTNSAGATPWNIAQQVTVTAVDDAISEGAHSCAIVYTASSSDANYIVAATNHPVNVSDNDGAGITVSTIAISEGGAGVAMDVVLLSDPTADVTITLASDAQCTLSTNTLTFTNSAGATPWNIVQQVTVTAVDDAIAEGAHSCVIVYTASSSDANYIVAATNHPVNVSDNDGAGITVSTIAISEGGAGVAMDVVLLSDPTADVTITLASDAQCTLSANTLTFTNSAGATPWNITQQITVTAVDDAIAEGAHSCVIVYTASSSDSNYIVAATNHPVAVIDNDAPGIFLGAVTVAEGSSGVAMNARLFTEPTADVTLTLIPDAQCALMPTTLTFTDSAGAAPWNIDQQVMVTAVDDLLVEANPHDCVVSVSATSSDTTYNGVNVAHLVSVRDNDSDAPPAIPAETFLCGNLRQQTNGAMTGSGDINNVVLNGVYGNTYCSVLALNREFLRIPAEVGNAFILDQGVVQALDVYGLLPNGVPVVPFEQQVQICFMGSGSIYFLSSFGGSPPPVQLPSLASSPAGYRCVSVPNSGKVVLVSTPSTLSPMTLPSAPATSTILAQGACQVTTTFAVRLRATPDTSGEIMATLPFDLTLVATEYMGGWYRVIYLNGQGWVSDQYLTTRGNC